MDVGGELEQEVKLSAWKIEQKPKMNETRRKCRCQSLPPLGRSQTRDLRHGERGTQSHVDSSVHTHRSRRGLADLLPARLGQLLRKWASLHRTTMTQAHPRQRDWRARNEIEQDKSQKANKSSARVTATGVFNSRGRRGLGELRLTDQNRMVGESNRGPRILPSTGRT